MCLLATATFWMTGSIAYSPESRAEMWRTACRPQSGCSGPPWWPGGRSDERTTARAEARSMSLTGVPAASLSFVRATMSAGAVSSTNCTRGSMDCGYATGRTIGVILLRSRVPACPVSSRGCPVSAGRILLFWGGPGDTGDLVGEVDLAVIGWLVAYGLAGV